MDVDVDVDVGVDVDVFFSLGGSGVRDGNSSSHLQHSFYDLPYC